MTDATTQLAEWCSKRDRTMRVEDCNKPTRHGKYLIFSAQGLSPGNTFFVGVDLLAQAIVENLGAL